MLEGVKPMMTVLVAGLRTQDSQFSRALERYGCEIVRTSPDCDSPFTLKADAAIVVKAFCSTQKFLDVKNAYKGKAVFVPSHGFSEVKADFEQFYLKHTGCKTMDQAMAEVSKRATEFLAEKRRKAEEMKKRYAEALKKKPAEGKRGRHPPEIRAQLKAVIAAGMDANPPLTIEETIQSLTIAGLFRTDGKEYTQGDIQNMRSVIRGDRKAADPGASLEPKQITAAQLIGATLANEDISDADKLAIVKEINEGKITTMDVYRNFNVTTQMGPICLELEHWDLKGKPAHTTIRMDKQQAKVVLMMIEKIKHYVASN